MKTLEHYGNNYTYPVYSLHPSGLEIGPKTAESAIASGELVSNEDGLIAGLAQTWTVKP